MYVIEVMPLGRRIPLSSLSYFASTYYPRGTILSVPIRQQMTPAIVSSVTEVSKTKTALRAATFTLRKLPPQEQTNALPEAFLAICDRLADFYATSPGAVLFALLPGEVKHGTVPVHAFAPPYTRTHTYAHYIFEASEERRESYYAGLVREQFAQGSSVLIIAPTIADIKRLCASLGSGITKHTIELHSTLGKKRFGVSWAALADTAHPKLIITTPQYGFIDRSDIRTVILERSRAGGYRMQARPHLDYRHAYHLHAREHDRGVISSDLILRSEDIAELESGTAEPLETYQKRIPLSGTLRVIDTTPPPESSTPFTFFSDTLLRALDTALSKKERVFLFAARRGLAPIVTCMDCGHIFRDPESGAPLSLHRTTDERGAEVRWFTSSVSGYRERARDLCPECNSWRLRERGIGIQQAYDVLREHVDQEKIILFDHTTARTPATARKLCEQFFAMKGGVLLGTALALPYLKKSVNMSAVTSMEALQAIPSWQQQEEILGILMRLREKTGGTVFVQTRSPDAPVLDYASKGRVADFHGEELALRKQFHYPPYATLIHFTWQGAPQGVEDITTTIKTAFAGAGVTVYSPAPQAERAEKMTRQALIRVPTSAWPDEGLVAHIRALPPAVRVVINPDRIV